MSWKADEIVEVAWNITGQARQFVGSVTRHNYGKVVYNQALQVHKADYEAKPVLFRLIHKPLPDMAAVNAPAAQTSEAAPALTPDMPPPPLPEIVPPLPVEAESTSNEDAAEEDSRSLRRLGKRRLPDD
jgi:hypothetical protein